MVYLLYPSKPTRRSHSSFRRPTHSACLSRPKLHSLLLSPVSPIGSLSSTAASQTAAAAQAKNLISPIIYSERHRGGRGVSSTWAESAAAIWSQLTRLERTFISKQKELVFRIAILSALILLVWLSSASIFLCFLNKWNLWFALLVIFTRENKLLRACSMDKINSIWLCRLSWHLLVDYQCLYLVKMKSQCERDCCWA